MKIWGLLVLLLASIGSAQSSESGLDVSYESLVSDHRANAVGESLTVLIFEQASSTTTADTDTSESFGISGSIDENQKRRIGSIDLSNNQNGGGSISREGELVASVSVTIEAVAPNGEMSIRGEQLIEFNEERQYIKISGSVRPEDISAQNTVLSTRVSNAKITYVGDGLLGRKQKPGVLSRLFGWLF